MANEIDHLIKAYGVEKTIEIHNKRIYHAKNHPKNPFFIGVIKDSESKLKILKSLKK